MSALARRSAIATWTGAIAAGSALVTYAIAVEPQRLSFSFVRRVDARVRRATRFLLIADTHLHRWSELTVERIARAAAWAGAHGAEAAVIAGDIVDDDRHGDAVGAALRRALAPLRMLYTTGNHDTHDVTARWPDHRNDRERIAAALGRAGLERIDDRVVTLGGLTLVGIGWPGRRPGAPAAARAAVAATDGAVVITHSPDHLPGLDPARVALALCGHTHGGQVRLPLVGAPWTPVRLPLPRLAGRMRLGGIDAYVSRGIGHTVPVRLGSVPEAVLVEVAPG